MSRNFVVMVFATTCLLALLLALQADAQIPKPCANADALTERKCCPIPTVKDVSNPGPCGFNIGRGWCQEVSIANKTVTSDVRINWPIGYFNRTCVCYERFGGYDCGECSFAYMGDICFQKIDPPRKRVSITTLTDEEWAKYRSALETARRTKSRYVAVTTNNTGNVQDIIKSMVNPTIYGMFVWMHHYAAKDSELIKNPRDFAHESSGFPTWHRLYLLWLENEIQNATEDPMFTLHYWDWRDPDQRRALFTEDRLGTNNNGFVEGDLFQDWMTSCWNEVNKSVSRVPTCKPTVPTGLLRRCPIESACGSDTNWPTYRDVNTAVAIKAYDAHPYNKYVTGNSFRNFMEGFLVERGSSCGNDNLCTEENGYSVRRKLHNTVHVILGIGYFKNGLSFNMTGVMGDVAASPNDPIFISHHTMVDCILEAWLQRHKHNAYPESDEIHMGHRANDSIVPFVPLYTHAQMFKTADNFGYECTLDKIKSGSLATIQASALPLVTLLSISLLAIFE